MTRTVSGDDYAEISNLYAFYNLCSDGGDAEGYAGCFTTDGVMDQVSRGLVIRGRADLVAYKRQDAASRGGRYRRHWNSGLYLRHEDDDRIRGICYLFAYNGDPGKLPVLQACGSYDDTIVREAGAWKFACRRLTMEGRIDMPPGVPIGNRS